MRTLILLFVLASSIFMYAEEKSKNEPVYVEEDGLKILVKDEEFQITRMVEDVIKADANALKDARARFEADEPVTSLKAGIPLVQKAMQNTHKEYKIEGYARINGWFIYAAGYIKSAQGPDMFHWGYAVKAGTKKFYQWGGW